MKLHSFLRIKYRTRSFHAVIPFGDKKFAYFKKYSQSEEIYKEKLSV